ncbi:MAG: Na(+)-translocating NADH-quinone reductase subunit A [bacterium]|nr:Na(+)-translocating NADH-quinone reductase subunit A [bacterium]
MALIKIKKGLNVPIAGDPEQSLSEGNRSKQIAVVGYDYVGMKPTLKVSVGDHVKLGQLLFTDKKMEGVNYTSPAAGTIVSINRGHRRVFESLVIECDETEEAIPFDSHPANKLATLERDEVKRLLVESGMWTALRARPFEKTADPTQTPHSIFITAMDTNPLAPSMDKILEGKEKDFENGLVLLSRLTDGKLHVCKAPDTSLSLPKVDAIEVQEFAGPHPAGNVGTHIHFVDPVHRNKTVWHISAQDTAALGQFITSGKIPVERVIALAGPSVKKPRLIKTRMGACMESITKGELTDADNRIVSGSVLSGRTAAGNVAFLGRYHQQVIALEEDKKREFLGWLAPGLNLFSLKKILLSSLMPGKKFNFTTNNNGGHRAVFPIGSYEKIMPMDMVITYLLRALMVDDLEEAENLGCLELAEEDLALCTYVSPAKIEYGCELRRNLTTIEKEG